ncbi:hypothetical protein KC19_4G181000 [Ceratodon purpureus]|uniref:Uncharacterized protein n=1 Tax=Ceratodon purpureus TaxID=3225 RepID=A0A8T0IC30_CERPU|nr:hypothetical protein KC19_4G181000 [Ceratodon purpureus]
MRDSNGSTLPPMPADFHSQLPMMTPPPFFQGFTGSPNQMSFMFPHTFMPHVHGVGFPPPVQGSPSAPIDLTEQSKPAKKRRVVKKKKEGVKMDVTKEELELLKHVGPWKDHWVIQLITIRADMHNTFSAPPKQGIVFLQFSSTLFHRNKSWLSRTLLGIAGEEFECT